MTVRQYIERLKQKQANENLSNCIARDKQKDIRKEISEILDVFD